MTLRFPKGARIGVCGSSMETELKQKLLLFDRLALPSIGFAIKQLRAMKGGAHIANDLEYCADAGLIIEYKSDEVLDLINLLAVKRGKRPKDEVISSAPEIGHLFDLLDAKKRRRKKSDGNPNTVMFGLADYSMNNWTRMVARKLRLVDGADASAISPQSYFLD